MSEVTQRCVNHPDAETRLSCTTCGDPICVRCMRQAAVGQKCPRCARQPRSALARGKPRDYVRLALVGPLVVVVGGGVYGLLLGFVGGFSLILAGFVGFGVGRSLRWAVRNQTQQPFATIAVVCGVLAVAVGLLLATGGILPRSPFLLLAYVVGGFFANRALAG